MDWKYMPDTMHYMKVAARAKKVFRDFTLAGVNRSEDGVEFYEWRNKDGSNDYHSRFVVDVYNGALYVTGDLGEGILKVTGNFTLENWASVAPDYFVEKLKCCSTSPRFDEDLFRVDFIRELRELGYDLDENDVCDMQMLDELAEFFNNNPEGCLPVQLRESFEQVTGIDEFDWMKRCGRRFPNRVIYWKVALETIKELTKKYDDEGGIGL